MSRIAALIMLALVTSIPVPGSAVTACTDAADATIDTQALLGLEGRYALPDRPATTLVVFAHGYRNRSSSWEPHLLAAARDHGVIAVAMDYTGTGPEPGNRGWRVKEGAADSIEAAQVLLEACPGVSRTAIFGISMGGNTAGLAVAAGAERAGDKPLFDHLVAVEPAVNSTETYLAARALSPAGDAYIVGAREDFEAECGGPIEAQPACYAEINVLARTPDVAASGVKGVVLVHGLADGLVPSNQSREFALALRAAGVPTDHFSVARRNDWQNHSSAADEGGTTADSHVVPRLGQPSFDLRPLAGHGWEGSTTHIVIKTGFDRLWALLEDGAEPSNAEYLVDADLGTTKLG